jgi:CubicO group peptidase (beta-lactamase class C family)
MITALSIRAAVPVGAQTVPQTDAALDNLISEHMADANIMGAAAAVVLGGEVVWSKGYGFADHERTQPFTPHTRHSDADCVPPA